MLASKKFKFITIHENGPRQESNSLHMKSIIRPFWIPFLLLLGMGSTTCAANKPNVLLLLVDDLKPALGTYSDALAITPNIDGLAARGMRFDLAYCNQAVCAASRNSLMLGSRPTSIGSYSLGYHFRRTLPNAVTFTQHFMKHGYRAEGIGKIYHTGHGNKDDEKSWSAPWKSEPVVEYLLPESTDGGKLTREEAYFTNQMLGKIHSLPRGAVIEIADVSDNAYADGRTADEGIKRLQAAKLRDMPFFLILGFAKPHLPFTAPKKYFDLHDPQKFKLAKNPEVPKGAPPIANKHGGEITNYKPIPKNGIIGDNLARQLIHGYYSTTSYVDAQIGRVLTELDRLQLADDTIIVLWGDHGWHFGDHGIWTKHTNFEQATRIPLIIVAPGITSPGSHSEQLVETVDLFPTISSLAGLPAPAGPQPIDGLDLSPVLKDPSIRIRDHAYHCWRKGGKVGRAIRTDRYRMVEWKSPGKPGNTAIIELYDYQTDPFETQNLASKQPKIVQQMRKILARHPEAVLPK